MTNNENAASSGGIISRFVSKKLLCYPTKPPPRTALELLERDKDDMEWRIIMFNTTVVQKLSVTGDLLLAIALQ